MNTGSFIGICAVAAALAATVTYINVTRPDVHNDEAQIVQTLDFFQNDKTKLCFAFTRNSVYSTMFSNVPCTPEVLAEAQKNAKL